MLRPIWKKLRRLRPFIAWVAIAALIQVLILPALTQQRVRVQVLIQALEATQLAEIEAQFEQENPDIDLEIIEAPNNTNQVEDLYTSAFLLGESPYDLVYMDIVWVPKFAAAGWLLDLGDRVSQAELDEFLDGDVNGGRYQGKLYRMPFRSDVGLLYYRTDWLEEAGTRPPETFTELVDISRQLQQQDLAPWGYLWQGKQYEGLSAMFVEVLEGYGAFWIDPDTLEVGLDRPAAIEAVEFLKGTIGEISPPGVTTYDEEPTRRLFQNGEAAFLRNWPYVYSLASNPRESQAAGSFAIKPMVHSPNATSGACQGGWGMGISATSPHPDEAWRVAEFFARAETQKQYSLKHGYLPSRRSLFRDPVLMEQYDYFPEILEIIEKSVLRPPIAQYSQASDILQRYLSAALTGEMTAEAAMNTAARETRTLLKRAS